ncbi:DUF4145 domain-containing protein [Vibrio sp. 2-Bac 85]
MGKITDQANVISDYEFVKQVSVELADYYKQAMSFYVSECYPDALTNYRKCLGVIVTLASNALGIESDTALRTLDKRIQKLANSSRIHYNSAKLMLQIKDAGNKGTHSEDYPDEDFLQLTVDTQGNFLNLVKKLYILICNGEKPLDYECILENELSVATLSHKALFENDSNAQYFIARKLNMNAQRILLKNTWGDVSKHIEVELSNGDKEARYHNQESARDTLIAYQLFNACQVDTPKALYELGKMILSDGHWLNTKEDQLQAVMYIQRAALSEIVEASSLFGRICLHGLYGREVDVEWALELLEDASKQGDSKAVFALANYYLERKNNDLALEYFSLATDYGSAKAQFLLAKYLIEGVLVTDKDIDIDQLLNDAWNSGVHKARLYQARRLSSKSGKHYSQEAQAFYEEYARKSPLASELLECAQYMIRFSHEVSTAYHYLMTALQISNETNERKLNLFLSYILNNTEVNLDESRKERFFFNFPTEVMLDPEKIDVNELLIRDAFNQKRLAK